MIQAGSETLLSQIHKSINPISNKEELPDQWKKFNTVSIYKNGDITGINFIHNVIQYPSLKVKFTHR
jgi:hypothetical protein